MSSATIETNPPAAGAVQVISRPAPVRDGNGHFIKKEKPAASWFDVSVKGLGLQMAARDKKFIFHEVISNSLDADATQIVVDAEMIAGREDLARIVVTDNAPGGFADITHAYTMYAESIRKADAESRGRFNFGEKMVLSLCKEARVVSENAAVHFVSDGTRVNIPDRTQTGTRVEFHVRITAEELSAAVDATRRLLIPNTCTVTVNDQILPLRAPVHTFRETLQTEAVRENGTPFITTRATFVELYEVMPDETACVFEMGIPVEETGDKWHVNVCQKIKLPVNRDHLLAFYRRELRALVLNELAYQLTEEETTEAWVLDALTDPRRLKLSTVKTVLDTRFGVNNYVLYDGRDKQANKTAVANGMAVIDAKLFGKDIYTNLTAIDKQNEVLKKSGFVLPTASGEDVNRNAATPAGEPLNQIEAVDTLTEPMMQVLALTIRLAQRLIGVRVVATVLRSKKKYSACYVKGVGEGAVSQVNFNLNYLPEIFFDNWQTREGLKAVLALLADEFAHQTTEDHLSFAYHDALCALVAQAADAALHEPQLFAPVPAEALQIAMALNVLPA